MSLGAGRVPTAMTGPAIVASAAAPTIGETVAAATAAAPARIATRSTSAVSASLAMVPSTSASRAATPVAGAVVGFLGVLQRAVSAMASSRSVIQKAVVFAGSP